MITNNQFLDISQNLHLWDETIQIYNDSFPQWEREDSDYLLQKVKDGIYKMFMMMVDQEVVGFYVLDVSIEFDYVLLAYVAIKEKKRGKGLGSKLCLHAIDYFLTEICNVYFLTEAQERQAKLYSKLGFSKLDLDYKVPAFNSDGSVPMSLMIIQKDKKLDYESLSKIIKDIFHRGYSLEENDNRLIEQLNKIPSKIKIIN